MCGVTPTLLSLTLAPVCPPTKARCLRQRSPTLSTRCFTQQPRVPPLLLVSSHTRALLLGSLLPVQIKLLLRPPTLRRMLPSVRLALSLRVHPSLLACSLPKIPPAPCIVRGCE